MSKVKSAPQKKQLSYERDHFSPAEYPKGFRKNWPRKKARANRTFRRKVAQLVDASLHRNASRQDDLAVEQVARERVQKWDVETLRERIARTQERREASHGAKKARQENYQLNQR